MLNLKILCDVFGKMPKCQQHFFDKLTFIIQTFQMSHCAIRKKLKEKKWVMSAEEGRGSPQYLLEGFSKFGP